MRAIVSGATGFVGSHLVERLLKEAMEVVCLVRPASNRRWLSHLPVEYRVASLHDPQALAQAVANVDLIFHVAGLTRSHSEEEYLAVNATGTRHLLDAACKAATPPRLVYVSSLAAAGPAPPGRALLEDDPPHPLPGYGASKLAAEEVVLNYAERLPVVIVRPPAVYGPRDTNFLPVFRMARKAGLAPVLGGPDGLLTFVYATDLAEGTCLAGLHPRAIGRTYFIGGGTHTQAELADAIAAALGRDLRRLRVPGWLAKLAGEFGELKWALTGRPQILSRRKVRDALQPRWTCSWARATSELGYLPKIDLREGIRLTAEWYVREGWL